MFARRTLKTVWPAVLLLAYAATWRRAKDDPRGPIEVCLSAPQADVASLEHCAAIDPLNVESLTKLGDAYHAEGRDGEAETVFSRALALDPHDGPLHLRLGKLRLVRGDVTTARASAQAAMRWLPGSPAAADLERRVALHHSGPGGH